MDIQSFITKINDMSEMALDFVTPLNALGVEWASDGAIEDALLIKHPEISEVFGVTEYGHMSLADAVDIPRRYYRKMLDSDRALLRENVAAWVSRSDESKMVRTLNGNARAFLSPSYNRIDHVDVMHAAAPILHELDMKPKRAEISERRMYLSVMTDRLVGEVKVGDPIQGGLVISNSEVGYGAFRVEMFIFRLVCTNGMVVPANSIRKIHRGSKLDDGILSDETRMLEDAAFISYVRDSIRAMAQPNAFQAILDRMREVSGIVVDKPMNSVKVLTKKTGLGKEATEKLLSNFIGGGDNTVWGLLNAATAVARDIDNPDTKYEVERSVGVILNNDSDIRELLAA